MYEQTAVLDQIILVNLDVSLWSGRTKIRPQDLVAAQGKLPPESLASLGHKKTIDPAELRPFQALKKEMERACLEVGTRFLGGYAIPEDHFDALATKLNDIKRRSESAKVTLLTDYDARIESWISKHDKWANIIRRAVVPSAVVGSRIRFNWMAVRVAPATTGDGELAGSTDGEVTGLGSQLFREVAQAAGEAYRKSYEGKDKVGQRAVRPVKAIRRKMESLRFVDRRIGPICREVDSVLETLPKTGDISGREFLALRGLIILLSDDEDMKRAGAKALGDKIDNDDTEVSDTHDSVDGIADQHEDVEAAESEEIHDSQAALSEAEEQTADESANDTSSESSEAPAPQKKAPAPTSGWFF